MIAPTAELPARVYPASEASARLSTPERARLAFEILLSYVWVRQALRRFPAASVAARVRSTLAGDQQLPARTPEPRELAQAQRLGAAVARTLALAPGDTRCLTRSLVLSRMLSRRGLTPKLVIGVRTAPEFLAHAWVELAGVPVLPPGDETFGRLVEL